MRAIIRTLAIAGLLGGVLAGCTTVGSSDFACPGRPEGVRCASALEVYQATESSDSVAATHTDALGDEPERAARVSARRQVPVNRSMASAEQASRHRRRDREQVRRSPPPVSSESTLATATTSRILPRIDKPVPVRTPARVMRVWIAPWEDKRGVFHSGGYAFVEIEARRWALGEPAKTEPARFFSMHDASVTSGEAGGEGHSAGERADGQRKP